MSNDFENIPQLVKNQQDAVKTTVEAFPRPRNGSPRRRRTI